MELEKHLHINGIEASVRPNLTSVMPNIRSGKTQEFITFVLWIVGLVDVDSITTGRMGNTHYLRSSHKII